MTGTEAAVAFTEAVRVNREYPVHLQALTARAHLAITEALLAEVARRKPKATPIRWESVEGHEQHRLSETTRWASRHLGAAEVAAVQQTVLVPFQAEADGLVAETAKAEEREDELAALAIFARVLGAKNVVYTDTSHRNQSDERFYRETSCLLRRAILCARGFEASVEPIEHGYRVVSDAPPEVGSALRHWRLDDVRLLAEVGAANLKVLFHPSFPYAGYWDWPMDKRERRTDPSFNVHRANEDAHLAINRVTP